MPGGPPASSLQPAHVRDLAKVVEVADDRCTVQFLDDGSVVNARISDAIRLRGIVVRPYQLVVVAAHEPSSSPGMIPYEVVWRGPHVATVTSVEGDAVTYDTGYAPHRGATKRLEDARPADERRPLQAGQQIVIVLVRGDPEAVSLLDLAVDGRPLHPDRLRADWVARSQAAQQGAAVDPRRIVADGYDRIAERYAQWVHDEVVDEVRSRYLGTLLASLPQGAQVLDLGCGGGGPTTRQLASRFALTGVDISTRQIELARQALPHATFLCADMTRLRFPPGSFDGVVAFYSFLHLPHGELPALLARIGEWLRPDGILVATLAGGGDTGTVEPDWLGAPMYFSGYATDDTRRFVEQAGLAITSLREERILENGRPVGFLWLVARRQALPESLATG